jgi:hypothetical protein
MRLLAWSSGVGVLVIAFLISTRSTMAATPDANGNVSLIEKSARSTVSDRFTVPLGPVHSSSAEPMLTVAVPKIHRIGIPRNSMLHPKVPNIHTRPKKKNNSWWPFGKK